MKLVSLDISVPDAFPRSAIPPHHKRLTFFDLLLVNFLLVLLTVPAVSMFRTACISAGLLWLYWQHIHHLLYIEKAPASNSCKGLCFWLIFHNIILAHYIGTKRTTFLTLNSSSKHYFCIIFNIIWYEHIVFMLYSSKIFTNCFFADNTIGVCLSRKVSTSF